MTKEEILELPTLSEEERYKWLHGHNVFEFIRNPHWGHRWESLEECAFRLRDEWQVEHPFETWNQRLRCLALEVKHSTLEIAQEDYWVVSDRAQPIYWIMAALLAKLERNGE